MSVIRRPLAFVLAASNHGSMIVNRQDYRMIDEQRGYGVGFQILNAACFDPEEVGLMLGILKLRQKFHGNGVVALDCGANIGVHTIEWARHMSGWGSVMAFEPQERIYYALAGNIALNNCFNASARLAAVGKEKGTIRIPVPDYMLPSSFGSLELHQTDKTEFIGQKINYDDDQLVPVEQLSIDSLDLRRVDLLKIDVEGMEWDVLQGASQTLATLHPVLLLEIIKSDKNQIERVLAGHGYRLFMLGINLLAVHEQDPLLGQIKAENGNFTMNIPG